MDLPKGINLCSPQGTWLEWVAFKNRFMDYLSMTGQVEDETQVDKLINCLGIDVIWIKKYLNSFNQMPQGSESVFTGTIEALDKYFRPPNNHQHHSVLLAKRSQLKGENNHQYIVSVNGLALQCDEWCEATRSEMVCARLLAGMRDQALSIELQRTSPCTAEMVIQSMRENDSILKEAKNIQNTKHSDDESEISDSQLTPIQQVSSNKFGRLKCYISVFKKVCHQLLMSSSE